MFDKPRKGYYPFRSIDEATCRDVLQMRKSYLELGDRDPRFKNSYLPFFRVMDNWRWCNYRQVYPSYDAGVVCENTSILENLIGVEIKGVLPCFGINIPRHLETLNDPNYGKLTHIVVDVSNRVHVPKGFPEKYIWAAGNFLNPAIFTFIFFFEDKYPRLFSTPSEFNEPLSDAEGRLKAYRMDQDLSIEAPEIISKGLAWAFNMCVLMKSYPQYVTKERCQIRVHGEKRISTEHHVHIGKEISFERPVSWSPPGERPEPTGATVETHWRKGHWRRQPHVERICVTENMEHDIKIVEETLPDGRVKEHRMCQKCGHEIFITAGRFPDNRTYHMVLLPPMLIGAETVA